jgi:hypothetical protein
MTFEEYYEEIRQRNRLNTSENGLRAFHYSDTTLDSFKIYFRGCYRLALTADEALSPLPSVKILHLPIKRHWFDLILRGIKKEEYRELKNHWLRRLTDGKRFKTFDIVRFSNGYGAGVPTVDVEFIDIHFGCPSNPDWCEKMEFGYVIKLGDILKSSP